MEGLKVTYVWNCCIKAMVSSRPACQSLPHSRRRSCSEEGEDEVFCGCCRSWTKEEDCGTDIVANSVDSSVQDKKMKTER